MPPITFVGAGGAPTWAGANATLTMPSGIKPKDTLFAMIGVSQIDGSGLPVAAGWTLAATFTSLVAGTLYILTRTVDGTEGPSQTIQAGAGPVAWGAAACVAYRGVSKSMAAITGSLTTISAAVNFACPSRVTQAYSDLYMGIVIVSDASVAVTPASGTTERCDFAQTGAGATAELEIFDYIPEIVGVTGVKTASTATNHSGIAVSVLIPAAEPPGIDKAINISPPGAIGLTTIGV